MSLSNLEEKVYFAALEAKGSTVSFETIKSWDVCSYGTLKVVVHSLVKKGYLQRIKKGVYIAKKPNEEPLQDAMLMGQSLYDGYLAFSTALYIHKLSEDMPFTIFVATKYSSYERKLGNYSVKAVALGTRLIGATKADKYNVSSIPKTLYDCFHMPQYAGGFPNVLRAVYYATPSTEQWKEFLYYADKFESHAFFQRVGYMLNLLKKINFAVPDFVISHMKSKVKYKTVLGKGKGTYIKEWMIMDCIKKQNLLSWWYHG